MPLLGNGMSVALDSYHLHIEERSLAAVLRPAGGLDPEEYSTWRDLSGVPATDAPSILDDNARETVASLLSMRRTVSP